MLSQIDTRSIPEPPEGLRLFCVVRNEALRLPFFIEHYAERGVDRLFIIDNASMESMADLLIHELNDHLFRTDESYSEAH